MWAKKFPKIAGALSTPSASPTVAPIGLNQPALATKEMNHDLRPITMPNGMPPVQQLAAQPNINEHVKRRALANIAMGKKGF
jgi:hypothetical protein